MPTPDDYAPTCMGVFCLLHEPSNRMLLAATRDLSSSARYHRELLEAGLHPNQELQEAYSETPIVAFDYYPCVNKEEQDATMQKLIEENALSGRLFGPTRKYLLDPNRPLPACKH